MNRDNIPKRNRPTSIDGFVVNNRNQTGVNSRLNSFNKYHRPSYKPQRTGSSPAVNRSVDSFSRSLDGFKSNGQATISTSHSHRKSAELSLPLSNKSSKQSSYEKDLYENRFDRSKLTQPRNKVKKSRFSLFKRSQSKQRSRKQKIALRTSAVLGSMILLVGGGLAIRAFLLGRNIFKGGGNSALLHSQDVDPSMLKGEGDGRINILVLGKGGPEQRDGPDLTDTIIVASIDPISHEAALLSIPRDFWVKSPSGGQSKINQVYFDAKHKALNSYSSSERDSDSAKDKSESAGINAMKDVVTETMGIPIHYYSMIDFAGFKKAIDTVGGIDINVTDEMAVSESMYINGKYYLDVKPGQQHFDGLKALAFSRSRKTSARGDFARSDRQRAVMIGLKDKVLSSGTLANPVRINQLMSDFSGQLSTDFSVNEMLRLYDLAKEIPSDKITSVNLQDYVGGDMLNGLSVQIPKAGMFDYSEIHNYVRNVMRDAFLKKENAKIAVLNGTETAGLATKKSEELKSFGYNIISIGDAPTKNYQNTVLIDLRNGTNKYTKNYLEKRLKVTASSTIPDNAISSGDADFVIILGSNETNR